MKEKPLYLWERLSAAIISDCGKDSQLDDRG
jgi:hypothetical protein